ncbi:MAG: hypothetical protein U5K69_28140 [Balneolaceae bacterium]|nr:hypothetical protein [Balneolaceae bacterium]
MAGTTSPSPKARNTTILFVTIISLLLIFSYYIFVYVPSHEDTMHKQHLRVLNKIAQNINTKLGSTIGNARNIAVHTTSAREKGVFDLDELQENSSLYNPNIQFEERSQSSSGMEGTNDEMNGEPKFEIEVLEKKYGNPGIYITDYAILDSLPRRYHFSISAENLVSNLLRFDHFEKFALFTPERVLYETHPTGSKVKVPFDTLLDADKQISTSYFREIQYGGLPHVAYFRPLQISNEHQWMLVGFISSDKVNSQKYSLSPLFSIILLLFIILTFLSIPFIKIKIMHVREHLTVKEVAFSFISATFIISILILLLLLGYTYVGLDRPAIEDELQTLSGNISNELVAEIDTVLSVFKHQETLYDYSYQNLFEIEMS